jgi:hypothetical protein
MGLFTLRYNIMGSTILQKDGIGLWGFIANNGKKYYIQAEKTKESNMEYEKGYQCSFSPLLFGQAVTVLNHLITSASSIPGQGFRGGKASSPTAYIKGYVELFKNPRRIQDQRLLLDMKNVNDLKKEVNILEQVERYSNVLHEQLINDGRLELSLFEHAELIEALCEKMGVWRLGLNYVPEYAPTDASLGFEFSDEGEFALPEVKKLPGGNDLYFSDFEKPAFYIQWELLSGFCRYFQKNNTNPYLFLKAYKTFKASIATAKTITSMTVIVDATERTYRSTKDLIARKGLVLDLGAVLDEMNHDFEYPLRSGHGLTITVN